MKNPFELSDIEDVRIIIKAKGKHYSIVPKNNFDKEDCKNSRIGLTIVLLQDHDIIDTALEDLQKKK